MGKKKTLKKMLRKFLRKWLGITVTADIHYMEPSGKLKGKRIIVTGGGRGLGYAMAKKFKEEGAQVLIAGRDVKTLRESAERIGCQFLQLDVQDTGAFASFMDEADKMLGGVNCLVNNAGISLHEKGFLAVSPAQFDLQFNTNLKGGFFLAQAFIRKCKVNEMEGIKNILFTSSETGMTVDERPYGLTKAALNSLLQGLAYRYVNEGYRVNAIAPGVTISDMVGKRDDGDLTYAGNITGRYYLPEEVAEIACFLLSDISNCLNGQILVCNEGKTINARWK